MLENSGKKLTQKTIYPSKVYTRNVSHHRNGSQPTNVKTFVVFLNFIQTRNYEKNDINDVSQCRPNIFWPKSQRKKDCDERGMHSAMSFRTHIFISFVFYFFVLVIMWKGEWKYTKLVPCN